MPDGLSAHVHVPIGGRELPILAEFVEMDDATGDLAITFPSLAGWGLADAAVRAGTLRLDVRSDAGATSTCEVIYALVAAPAPEGGGERK